MTGTEYKQTFSKHTDMKTSILSLILSMILMTFAPSVYAGNQGKGNGQGGNWKKEMREFKLKFLAQEMELQEEQQKQFVTLYTQMTDEKDAVMRKAHKVSKKIGDADNATEEECRQANEALLKCRDQDLAIEKKYDEKFRTFLTQKQIYKMKNAERKFREKLEKNRRCR